MANRSYLYALDSLPEPGRPRPPAHALSEWNWDIPLVHKVLLSGSPRLMPSLIWSNDDALDRPDAVLAVVGDYDDGLANLQDFLVRIPHVEAAEQAAHALAFLNDPTNRRRHVWLEAAEIFDMTSDVAPLRVQAEELRDEASSDWSRAAASVTADGVAEATGTGSWRTVLYYGPFE